MVGGSEFRRRLKAAGAGLVIAGIGACCGDGIRAEQTAPPVRLRIEAGTPVAKVSPTLYGLMTEEINYSYDGGLYAELVRNRTFHDGWDQPAHWYVVERGGAQAKMTLDRTTSASVNRKFSLQLAVTHADAANEAGVKNEGYWGYPVRANETFTGSLWAKADSAGVGAVTVRLISDNTGKVVASAKTDALTTEWRELKFKLQSGAVTTSSLNHLELSVGHAGTVWFDMVSVFPPTYKNRPGGFRVDLMEKMAEMHPAFLRFPGGNYLEGDHISERFEWKKTIGPLVDRPTHPSPWHYHSSDGMGLLEFLEWCEDLKMQPVLAVYAGYSMMQEHVEPGKNLDPYVQEALEEIEYVTGDSGTQWGAVRAKNGHPEPFKLTYVEIGNEDFFDRSGSYDGRYGQFYREIKKKYPALQLIATAPIDAKKSGGVIPDVVDDHFYKRAEEFYADTHHYDKTDRNGPKVFVGEWATREGVPTPNFGSALGDAAWMTGMERNSDVVVMASYAPLLVNVNPGGMQWDTDLIGYDALSSYGSPSYYAQVLFAKYLGTEVVASSVEGGGPRFFYSVTKDAAKGLLYLKVVNGSSIAQPVEVKLEGVASVKASAKVERLSAATTAETNSLSDPKRIVPVASVLSGVGKTPQLTLPPYSITVLEVGVK